MPLLRTPLRSTHTVVVEAVLSKAGLPEGRADLVAGLAGAKPARSGRSMSIVLKVLIKTRAGDTGHCSSATARCPAVASRKNRWGKTRWAGRGGSCRVGAAAQQERTAGGSVRDARAARGGLRQGSAVDCASVRVTYVMSSRMVEEDSGVVE